MKKVIVWKKPDGSIFLNIPNERVDKTVEQHKARVEEASPRVLEYEFLGYFDRADLPQDREFRNQWRHNNGNKKVEVDPVLETAERWVRVRKERDKRLADSDGKRKSAEDSNAPSANDWKQYQKDLRDVPTQPDPKNITWPTEPS